MWEEVEMLKLDRAYEVDEKGWLVDAAAFRYYY